MKKSLAIIVGLLLLAVAMIGTGNAQSDKGKNVVRVRCPDTMVVRIYTLTKMFMKENPDITVDFWKGASVEGGILALLQDHADVGMSSRRLSDGEAEMALKKNMELVERLIGYGGIVILTHSSNPLNSLTVEQVQKIFKGDYASWKRVGGSDQPITVITVSEKDPGTVAFMQKDFLGIIPISSKAVKADDFPSVIAKVGQIPGSIGYVRARDALEPPLKREAGAKMLEIKQNLALAAVMPSRGNVGDGTYPIRRPYYLYYDSKASDAVRKYADFIVRKGWGPQEL
jgi:phosphate transport system substrate-binding protein